MKFTLTEKYELEEQIEQCERQIERLWGSCKAKDEEIERRIASASVFAAKTWKLLKTLGLTDKEIYGYYAGRICEQDDA